MFDEEGNYIYPTGLEALDDYQVILTFSDGKTKLFDCAYLLDKAIYAPLRDATVQGRPNRGRRAAMVRRRAGHSPRGAVPEEHRVRAPDCRADARDRGHAGNVRPCSLTAEIA